jgi:hypothetical protein
MKCVVVKQVTCEDCTQEEAEENPFDYAVDEVEIEQVDCEVLDVQEFK